MKRFYSNTKLILALRIIVGLLFIYASIEKIIDPKSFSDIIDNYRFSPVALSNFAALILPWIELIAGLGLISGIYLEGSNLLLMGLIVFFIFLMSRALVLGINTHCGCGLPSIGVLKDDPRAELFRRIIEDFIYLGMLALIQIKIVQNKKVIEHDSI